MPQLTQSQIDNILNTKLPEEHWIFMLGVGLVYKDVKSGVKFSAPYLKKGTALWRSLEAELHELFCNGSKPKEWVEDLITGDVRNLTIGIFSAITSNYNIGLGIAVPATALVLKKGVIKLCKEKKAKKTLPPVETMLHKKK